LEAEQQKIENARLAIEPVEQRPLPFCAAIALALSSGKVTRMYGHAPSAEGTAKFRLESDIEYVFARPIQR
jgi:hypothetical protein